MARLVGCTEELEKWRANKENTRIKVALKNIFASFNDTTSVVFINNL